MFVLNVFKATELIREYFDHFPLANRVTHDVLDLKNAFLQFKND